jgi:hypothetical protein
MTYKIRAIVKRPDERYGHMTNVSNKLENLQKIVGGYIEVIPGPRGSIIICNEEGKLRGLDPNMPYNGDLLVGTIIVCGTNEENFDDLPIDLEMAEWKMEVDRQINA